jgi:hypothetical protein
MLEPALERMRAWREPLLMMVGERLESGEAGMALILSGADHCRA